MLESAQLRAPDDSSGAFVVPAGGMSRLATESSMPVDGKPLADLLAAIPRAEVRGDRSLSIADVAYRSSDVRPGGLFFCVEGRRTDGHLFAGDAAAAGAAALVVQRWLDVTCVQVMVPSVLRAMGSISSVFFGHPSSSLGLELP